MWFEALNEFDTPMVKEREKIVQSKTWTVY